MKCQICGENSGYYPLCKYHNELKDKGDVVKDKNGKWILKDNDTEIEFLPAEIHNTNCLICGAQTKNDNLFCKGCYQKVKDEIKNFDHNRSEKKISNHYFDLRQNLKNARKSEFEDKIILMRALAEEAYNIYDNVYLIDRVNTDILSAYNKRQIQDTSKNEANEKLSFNDIDFRNNWPREHQCDDGHYVRSLSEMAIDNWLYTHNYVHAYEKSVFMSTDPEAIVLSDFYLPQGDVYIEFWGIEDNEKYEKRKEQKIKLYDENGYNRIDLTDKDVKRLNDVMPRLLSKYLK